MREREKITSRTKITRALAEIHTRSIVEGGEKSSSTGVAVYAAMEHAKSYPSGYTWFPREETFYGLLCMREWSLKMQELLEKVVAEARDYLEEEEAEVLLAKEVY